MTATTTLDRQAAVRTASRCHGLAAASPPVSPRLSPPARLSLLAPLALLLLAATTLPSARASAQGTPQALIGGAALPGPMLQRQTICAPAARLCPIPYPPPPAPFAGGTAYDPHGQVIWDSNGPMLVAMPLPPACAPICPPLPVPGLVPPALVTGLAYDEGPSLLLVVDSTAVVTILRVPRAAPCAPLLLRSCPLGPLVPPGFTPGGLAFSEASNRLFVAISSFAGGPPGNLILVLGPGAGCAPLCQLPLPACLGVPPLGPITGLAFDDASNSLLATDGVVVQQLALAPGLCGIAAARCCPAPLAATYYGLDLQASHPLAVGKSCLGAPCPACPAMALATAGGDPVPGNRGFALVLNGAPPGVPVTTLLNFPGCGGGVPLLCGTFFPRLAGVVALPPVTTAGGACAGTATLPVPIPLSYAFCGVSLCFQDVLVCPGLGLGLTNAIDVTITDD